MPCAIYRYIDVIMGAIASQITSLTIIFSTVYSDADQRKHQSSVTGLCAGNLPVTGEFPAQMASNAENVSIEWRHHVMLQLLSRWYRQSWSHQAQNTKYAIPVLWLVPHGHGRIEVMLSKLWCGAKRNCATSSKNFMGCFQCKNL